MAFVHLSKGWKVPERETTPEQVYNNRRHFLKKWDFQA